MSPLTTWGNPITGVAKLQKAAREATLPAYPHEIRRESLPEGVDEMEWVEENKGMIKDLMQLHGAVVFRGFATPKTQPGFVSFYSTIGMIPCLDPLHSVSARPTIGDTGAVYEAVNKESRKNFFIGMHNEFVGTRAPRAAAFVCFKPAEVGGEFLVADGRRVFRDLDEGLLERLIERRIRYSVMELPFFGWVDKLPEVIRDPLMNAIRGLVSFAINAKVDFSVELLEQVGGYDNTRLLQARAPVQPPAVFHPVTGEPTWFCNVHSHASKLRKGREAKYGGERFEDGASQINKSDMYFGDDGELSAADLALLDEATTKNIHYIKMIEGDVVLLDNYKTMHGRNVFDGTRKHGVCWFGGWEGEEEQMGREWEELKLDVSK